MPDVASLVVSVTADTSAAERGLSDLGTKVQGAGSALTTALGGTAVAAVAGLGAAFVASVTAAADFEQQMSAVSAVSGASAAEMDALTQAALQLGKDTSFSAQEAAQGIEELVKAGVSIEDVIGGGARAALDLAAAGAVSVADAAEIASNAMNVFNLSGGDMGHVADVIAGAANASAISVTDYKFSLSAAGAVASAVGIDFESLSQAIAVMGQAGIKGSDAGTSLKTMMMNLIPSTNKQKELFRELGIVTAEGANQFFDATGKAKSFAEIAQVLQDALRGMTKEQQLATLETMFGSDAIRAGTVLMEAGAEGFDKMAASMAKVTAQQVAEERLNNLWGSVEKLKGSLQTAAIMLGSLFTPALKSLADMLTEHVNAGIAVLEKLPAALETIKQVFGEGWVPAENIDPLVLSVGNLAVAFRDTLLPAIQTVIAVVTATLIPAFQAVGAFIAAHPELIAGLVAAWATFAIVTTVVGWITGLVAAFGAISTAVTAAGGVLAAIIAVIGGPLTVAVLAAAAVIGLLTAAWIGNWGDIQGKTQAVIEFLGPYIEGALAAMVAFWEAHGATIIGILENVWTIVSTGFMNSMTAIAAIITAAGQIWNGEWTLAWTTLTTAAQAIWNGWAVQLEAALAILQALFQPAWDAITATIQGALDAIGAAITAAWDGFLATIQGALDAISAAVLAVWAQIPEDIRADLVLIAEHITTHGAEWVAGITTAGANMLAAITASLAEMVAAVTAWAGQFLAPITGLVSTASAAAASVGQGMSTAITSELDRIISAVSGWAGQFIAAVRGVIGQASSAGSEIGRAISQGIASGISAGAGAIRSAALSAARAALSAAKGALGIDSPSKVFAEEVGAPTVAGIIAGIESMTKPLARTMAELVTPPPTAPPVGAPMPAPALSAVVPRGETAAGPSAGLIVNVNVYGSALASRQEIADAVVVGLATAQQQGRTRQVVV